MEAMCPPLIFAELEAKPVPSKDLVQTNLTSFLKIEFLAYFIHTQKNLHF